MGEKMAQWATAISAIIAAIALSITVYKYWSNSNQAKVEEWQKIVVYELIQKNKKISFLGLKNSYIASAQQVQAFSLPSNEIQDQALRKVLLELQRDNLILYTENDDYRPNVFFFEPSPNELMAIVKKEQERKNKFPRVRLKILDILDKDCGNLEKDELYRLVSESIEIEFPVFVDMLNLMRGREINKLSDDTWCSTFDEKVDQRHNK